MAVVLTPAPITFGASLLQEHPVLDLAPQSFQVYTLTAGVVKFLTYIQGH